MLRPLSASDADAHIAMMQNPKIASFLTPDGASRDRSEEWRSFASMLGHWELRGFGFFSVEEKTSGDWVGRAGPWMPEGWPALECGWSITHDHWGKGYAPEAAIASIQWIFANYPDLPRIISVIDPANANSQAVAKKIGEQNTGEVFEYWGHRLDIWAAERDNWIKKFGSETLSQRI